jgi:hypothetical protein
MKIEHTKTEDAQGVVGVYATRLRLYDDETRQKIEPYMSYARADDETEIKRARLMAYRTITVVMPEFFDAVWFRRVSRKLREVEDSPRLLREAADYLDWVKGIVVEQAAEGATRSAFYPADAHAARAIADAAAHFFRLSGGVDEDVDAARAAFEVVVEAIAAAAEAARAAADATIASALVAARAAAKAADCVAELALVEETPEEKEHWNKLYNECADSAIETLRLACEIS